jgi:hypothetical protein
MDVSKCNEGFTKFSFTPGNGGSGYEVSGGEGGGVLSMEME